MKQGSTRFLKGVIGLIGSIALVTIVRFPLTEGRAVHLDLWSIYTDPFLVYEYLTSIAFFVALYQAFKLLGYIEQNRVFSRNSIQALRTIKYCAVILSIFIGVAALYIRISHSLHAETAKGDDPAGFLAMSFVAAFVASVVATAAAVFEKTLQSAIDIKSENDLTV